MMGKTPYEELLSRQTQTEPEFAEALAKNRSSLYTDLSTVALPNELEVVGYLFDLRYGPDHWSQQRMFSNQLPSNPDDARNVEPLVRRSQAHSTIAALRAERDEAVDAFKHLIVAMAQERLGVGDKEGGGLFIRNNRAETAEAEVKRLTEDKEALTELMLTADRFKVGELNGCPVHVVTRGPSQWAISDGGWVLNDSDEWEHEPMPSSRSDEFIARTRFTFAEATRRARAILTQENADGQ